MHNNLLTQNTMKQTICRGTKSCRVESISNRSVTEESRYDSHIEEGGATFSKPSPLSVCLFRLTRRFSAISRSLPYVTPSMDNQRCKHDCQIYIVGFFSDWFTCSLWFTITVGYYATLNMKRNSLCTSYVLFVSLLVVHFNT